MIDAILAALMWFAWTAGNPAFAVSQSDRRDPGCHEWHECRAMAESAAERGEYETFHDLAWRAVQTAPPRDPALMYLLARAQALSGRPHDALVMLDRLAEMGVASDAAANDDFIRTRQLPGWPAVAARIEHLRAPAPPAPLAAPAPPAAPVPAPVPAPPPVAAPVVTPPAVAPTVAPTTVERPRSENAPATTASAPPAPAPKLEAARFSTARFTVGGLAYDAVSRRFLFGDRLGRKLVSVSDGANHSEDLVRADSAGFHDISAIDIDDKRGDLWVASGADPEGAGTLHRLQLVSGRPLRTFRIAPRNGPVDLVDLAVTSGGTILLLDAASGRMLALRPRAASVETVAQIDAPAPVSLAVGSDEAVVYVAHGDGVSRVDLRTRKATRVAAPKGVSLAGLQQIRWHRNALIGVAAEEPSSRIVRFNLNASGRAVTRATTLEASAAIAGRSCVTISGDDLLYLAPSVVNDAGNASSGRQLDAAAFVAYRVHLR